MNTKKLTHGGARKGSGRRKLAPHERKQWGALSCRKETEQRYHAEAQRLSLSIDETLSRALDAIEAATLRPMNHKEKALADENRRLRNVIDGTLKWLRTHDDWDVIRESEVREQIDTLCTIEDVNL